MVASARCTTVMEQFSTQQMHVAQMAPVSHLIHVRVHWDIMEAAVKRMIAMAQYSTHHLCALQMERVLRQILAHVNQVLQGHSVIHGHVIP